MRKILSIAVLAMSLSLLTACGSLGPPGSPENLVPAPPAPLASTQLDEKTLTFAADTFDAVLYTVDALIAANVIVPETPRALKIANAIEKGKLALNAARAAQLAGQATTYDDAIRRASEAVALIRQAIGES